VAARFIDALEQQVNAAIAEANTTVDYHEQ